MRLFIHRFKPFKVVPSINIRVQFLCLDLLVLSLTLHCASQVMGFSHRLLGPAHNIALKVIAIIAGRLREVTVMVPLKLELKYSSFPGCYTRLIRN